VEDEVLRLARQRARAFGITPVEQGTGAALRLLAATLDAKSVVEIGTGSGVSGLWLLRGMRQDGILTTVDNEPAHQSLARATFTAAGIPSNRTRCIAGPAADVLPRLTDSGYDLVFCDGDRHEYPYYLAEAIRLLRVGGMVAVDNALGDDRIADPAYRDPATLAVRAVHQVIHADERLLPALLPVGNGLLCAVKRSN
jgi:predicted O-methyltransferase YrrM